MPIGNSCLPKSIRAGEWRFEYGRVGTYRYQEEWETGRLQEFHKDISWDSWDFSRIWKLLEISSAWLCLVHVYTIHEGVQPYLPYPDVAQSTSGVSIISIKHWEMGWRWVSYLQTLQFYLETGSLGAPCGR